MTIRTQLQVDDENLESVELLVIEVSKPTDD